MVSINADIRVWAPRVYSEQRFGAYAGVNATWKLPEAWTVSVSLNNLIAKDAESSSVFYAAQRGVGGLQYAPTGVSDSRRALSLQVRKNF